jgi:SNF2 family DNA or RNA helicase
LILGYQTLARDWTAGEVITKVKGKTHVTPGLLAGMIKAEGHPPWVAIFDEITAVKNPTTRTHQVCAQFSKECSRVYGATATLLKNSLLEGFGIYKVLRPDLFTNKTAFIASFCVTKLQYARGGRQIPIIVGYKNLDQFRKVIDPFFLGRHKHEVSKDLPVLMTREVLCELGEAEDLKYQEALSGVLELGDGDIKDYEETKALTSLVYCQLVVDSLSLLRFAEGLTFGTDVPLPEGGQETPTPVTLGETGSKEETLLDLLSEELEGQKVIVYTRFESLVGRLQALCKAAGIESVRITGAESDKKRDAAKTAFQTTDKVRVVFITDAASEAINLQAAKAMIFYDSPWSWGHYVQLLGRMIRIGSLHTGVLAYHLVAERPHQAKAADRKTIDHHVLEVLRKKKGIIDKVLGEGAVGALDFKQGAGTQDLIKLMQGRMLWQTRALCVVVWDTQRQATTSTRNVGAPMSKGSGRTWVRR